MSLCQNEAKVPKLISANALYLINVTTFKIPFFAHVTKEITLDLKYSYTPTDNKNYYQYIKFNYDLIEEIYVTRGSTFRMIVKREDERTIKTINLS